MSEEMTDKQMEDAKLDYDRKALRDKKMCEPSIDNLREAIKQFWIGAKTEPPVTAIHVQQDWLAAFDAMAEKAEGFEKLRILLEQYQYVGLAKLVRSDSYVVIAGKQNFDGAKLIEALKAVPND